MQVKVSFIYETDQYETYADYKKDTGEKNKQAFEKRFKTELEKGLSLFMEDNSWSEVRVRVITDNKASHVVTVSLSDPAS